MDYDEALAEVGCCSMTNQSVLMTKQNRLLCAKIMLLPDPKDVE